jgi:hypothetical protein
MFPGPLQNTALEKVRDFKKHIVGCVKFWSTEKPIKYYAYDPWDGLCVPRRHGIQDHLAIIECQNLKFTIPKERIDAVETALRFLKNLLSDVVYRGRKAQGFEI